VMHHARQTVHLANQSTALLVSQVQADFGQADYLNHCITDQGQFCQTQDEDSQQTAYGISPASGASGATMSKVYKMGELEAGDREAVFTIGSVGVPRSLKGFVLVLN
ncbi:MAG: hypothetical protein ACRDJI_09785, partial [Actinomycetota bacterium]